MRSILIASAILALAGCANSGTGSIPKPPPQTMQVDLQRYQGTWYELARLPMFFQRNCVQSEAHYGLRDDGRIDVTNRCRDKDGEWIEAKGVAEPQVEGQTDKLWVRFDNWASKLLPIKGDYWVIYHDEDWSVTRSTSTSGCSRAPLKWIRKPATSCSASRASRATLPRT